jgi:hypothetical protein
MSDTRTQPSRADQLLRQADEMVASGSVLDAVELLHSANVEQPDPRVENRLAVLRHDAFAELHPVSAFDEWPVPVEDGDDDGEPPQIPQIAPSELSAGAVRRAISRHGSAHVPGLLSAAQVKAFVDGIEHVLSLRESNADHAVRSHSSWFNSLPLPREEAQSLARHWVAGDGGMLACDSPRLLELLFTTYEAVGLREVVAEYLGERPALSANKATLRRARLDGKSDWHQDGAFLGSGIRALNIWVALTDCGVDAPGMDLVPRRFEEVQETGTGGAIFDWAVGPDVVEHLAADAPVVRPHFRAGDAMLFDDLFLHRTALDPSMTEPRHAIESWFFAPSCYPDGQVPIVW